VRRLFGGILLAVGILIAGLSGLCSLMVLFTSGEFSGFGMLPAVALFGGIPFAGGVAMVFGGRHLLRQEQRIEPKDVKDIFQ
jgi:hypothetical protein